MTHPYRITVAIGNVSDTSRTKVLALAEALLHAARVTAPELRAAA